MATQEDKEIQEVLARRKHPHYRWRQRRINEIQHNIMKGLRKPTKEEEAELTEHMDKMKWGAPSKLHDDYCACHACAELQF